MVVVLELIFKIISSLQKLTFQKCPIPGHTKFRISKDVQLRDISLFKMNKDN